MAGGGDSADGAQLKGLARYFNSKTDFGRANVSNYLIVSRSILSKQD
jgi:hypothetical protein